MSCMEWLPTLRSLLDGQSRIQLSDAGSGSPVDILALGSGWTWSFLGPAAGERGLRTAYTTREGRSGSIPFKFDPASDDTSCFEALPDAQTIVIVFPLYSTQAVQRLVNGYISTRSEAASWPTAAVYGRGKEMTYCSQKNEKESWKGSIVETSRTRFILLGSVGIWKSSGPTISAQTAPLFPPSSSNELTQIVESHKKRRPDTHSPSPWYDRHSPVDKVPRALAEDALLAFNEQKEPVSTSVLCLAGLWGHGRSPRRFVGALAPTKERLAQLGSVHLVHGHDVARAILAMHDQWDKAAGQRWALTNERVYDLWDLISQWGNAGEAGRQHFPQGPQPAWIQELLAESRNSKDKKSLIRSLPRTPDQLGFALDSSDFWSTFAIHPDVPWVD